MSADPRLPPPPAGATYVSPYSSNEAMFEAFVRCQDYSKKHRVDLGQIAFVLVAMQSTGKTTLLCALSGEALGGAISATTGTRRPVKYVLKYAKESRVAIDGKLTPLSQVFTAIGDLMHAVGNTFKAEEIVVEIEGPRSINIVFTDLMGVRAAGHDDNALIIPIVQRYIRDVNVVPLILVPMSHDAENVENDVNQLLKALDVRKEDVRGRAMLLCGRFDEKVRSISDFESLSRIFKLTGEIGLGEPFFFSCWPAAFTEANPQRLSEDYEQRRVFFATLGGAEGRAFDDFFALLLNGRDDADRARGAAMRKRCGLQQLVAAVEEKWRVGFSRQVPAILRKLVEQEEKTTAAARRMQKKFTKLGELQTTAEEYAKAYPDVWLSVYENRVADVQALAAAYTPAEKRLLGSYRKVTLRDITMDFRTEERRMRETNGAQFGAWTARADEPAFRGQEDLMMERQFSQTPLKSVEMRLSGGAAVLRVVRVWNYLYMTMPRAPLTVDEVLSLNGGSSAVDVVSVVARALEQRGVHDTHGVDLLAGWVRMLLEQVTEAAAEQARDLLEQQDVPAGVIEKIQALALPIMRGAVEGALQAVIAALEAAHWESYSVFEPHVIVTSCMLDETAPPAAWELIRRHRDTWWTRLFAADPPTPPVDPDEGAVPGSADSRSTIAAGATESPPSARASVPRSMISSRSLLSNATTQARFVPGEAVLQGPSARAMSQPAEQSQRGRTTVPPSAVPSAFVDVPLPPGDARISVAALCAGPEMKLPQHTEDELGRHIGDINEMVRAYEHYIKFHLSQRFVGIVSRQLPSQLRQMVADVRERIRDAILNLSGRELLEAAATDGAASFEEAQRLASVIAASRETQKLVRQCHELLAASTAGAAAAGGRTASIAIANPFTEAEREALLDAAMRLERNTAASEALHEQIRDVEAKIAELRRQLAEAPRR